MPTLAVRLGKLMSAGKFSAHPSSRVLGDGDDFQVIGVDAAPHPAEMIQDHAGRDVAALQFINQAVCQPGRPHYSGHPIPVAPDAAGPEPAPGCHDLISGQFCLEAGDAMAEIPSQDRLHGILPKGGYS